MGDVRTTKVFTQSIDETATDMAFALDFVRLKSGEPVGEPERHEFLALSRPTAGTMTSLGSLIRFDQRGNQVVDINGIARFMRTAMRTEEYERFMDLIEDPDQGVEMDMLGEVFEWLVEEYTGRPFTRSKRSSGGPPKNGRRSTAKRS